MVTLTPGTRLGPYEILAPLGAGGMGEVYRARDTRLDRCVAVKVLPSHLTNDPELRARFEREAKAVSSLNHPHICTLHDVGQHGGIDYLVMELVEGETLADRLKKGVLSLNQALRIGIEISGALDKAHRQGVIHRDLKPGNVMLTKAGSKLMDFGLAKLAAAEPSTEPGTLPTTASVALTGEGTLMGTVPYMAPEQLEGKVTDARSDLWAFGCVMYEMVTARRAFEGKSRASLIGAIMNTEPRPIGQLQPLTPPSLDRLVRVCLAKDPDDRLQTAHDVMQELKWIMEGASGGMVGAGSGHVIPTRRTWLNWALAGLTTGLVIGLTVAALLFRFANRGSPGVSRLLVSVGPAEELQDVAMRRGRLVRTAIALSPDGRVLVFAGVRDGQQLLYLRPFDQLEATPIAHTEGGASPFFSPDGKWLGFWAGGELKKVPLSGGPPVSVCKTLVPFGVSWGADDRIVFGRISGGLFQVPAAGGNPEELTSLDPAKGEVSHRLPHALPGGDVVLFTISRNRVPDWAETQVAAYDRRTRTRRVLIEGGADARYVSSGHVVYVRAGVLMATPFDLSRAEITGGPVGVLPDVMQAAYDSSPVDTGAAQVAVSQTGTLAYVTGGVFPQPMRSLVWVNRAGREDPVPLPSNTFFFPRVSPEGDRIAVSTIGRNTQAWVYEISRGVMTPLTTAGRFGSGEWTPDGKRLAYRGALAGPENIYWRLADDSGPAERLTTSPHHQIPAAWSPDGKTLLFYSLGLGQSSSTEAQLWELPLGGDREPRPLIEGPFGVSGADVSPDGQWLAYASNQSGRNEVYVQPFGRPGARRQVSTSGGISPVWRRDGHELFYLVTEVSGDLRTPVTVMAVPVTTRPTFKAGSPAKLFEGVYWTNLAARNHDVAADGQRFLFVKDKEIPPARLTHVILVQNWTEELKARVAAGQKTQP